mmetsp:Transcript_9230/g.24248  ORF Transcript_9230/g.24248 Transcript_9230/m.24248 type:complete len:343 (-) Transcript_9230:177-1205(-)|eukprot:CAMPEP_0117459068 /NCGR_PEP_ID=MMETSP0784-20121206/1271_1 /TAXON_ID=39447 /ORGANISM="" /LENGTH=342 /DNA_ID=CAMNT_0005252637 /DNA_START=32 /DNA_END=1060 /DNA_ORIENTATION=-
MDCSSFAQVASVSLVGVASEFAFASIGFGPAVLFEIAWEILRVLGVSNGDLESAVTDIVVVEIPCGLVQLFKLRKHLNWRLAVLYNIPYLITLPIGTVVLERHGRNPLAKKFLGLLFLILAGIQFVGHRRSQRAAAVGGAPGGGHPPLDVEPRLLKATLAMVVASSASGFLRGVFGVAGPPMMILLMYFSIDRSTWRCLAATNRLVTCAVQGLQFGLNSDINARCWRLYMGLAIGGLAGLSIGNVAAPHVDADAFKRWLILFLAAGSLLMVSSGTNAYVEGIAAFLVALAMLSVALSPLVRKLRRRPASDGAFPLAAQGLSDRTASDMGPTTTAVHDIRSDV